MAKIKQKWRCVFNYSREVYILYCYAFTERQAWQIMCLRLAKMHNVHPSHVFALFDGHLDNFSIEIELEIKEIEEEKSGKQERHLGNEP